MKNINDEIANITKVTIEKIIDIQISDIALNETIEKYKGNLN